MKMKKITSAALALGLALGLAGCGGNQAAGGSDLEYIKEKGRWSSATRCTSR